MPFYVFSNFKNALTLARKNIFSFRKKFPAAMIILNWKQQQKSTSLYPSPPAPLKIFSKGGGQADDYVILGQGGELNSD